MQSNQPVEPQLLSVVSLEFSYGLKNEDTWSHLGEAR